MIHQTEAAPDAARLHLMADAALQNGDSSSTNSMAERTGMPRKKVAVREQEVEG